MNVMRMHLFKDGSYLLIQLKTLAVLLFAFMTGQKSFGEELYKNEFNHITKETGLAGSTANKIVRDSYGRMWIATNAGVSIFNGILTSMVSFEGEDGKQPFVFDICECPSEKTVYAATTDHIYVFSNERFSFVPFIKDMKQSHILCDNKRLYITNRKGFYVHENGKTIHEDVKGDPNVHCMALNPRDHSVWMLTKDALCHYIPSDKSLERKELKSLFGGGVNFSCMAVTGKLFYIGTKNFGLYKYDMANGKLEHIDGMGADIAKLYNTGRGQLCVATNGSGAYLLDFSTGKVNRSFAKSKNNEWGLPTNAVYDYLYDKNGSHWFAFPYNGLVYNYYSKSLFNVYRYGSFSTESLDIRSFYIDGSKKLIGTQEGLYFIDEEKGIVRYYTPSQLNGGNIVTSIEHFAGKYYIGTYDGGLNVLDSNTLEVMPSREYNHITSKASVLTLKRKGTNELWIGTDVGIAIINARGSIRLINNNNSGLPDCRVSGIEFSKDGMTWINGSAGLLVMNAQGKFVPLHQISANFLKERYMCSASMSSGMHYWGSRLGVYYINSLMTEYGHVEVLDHIMQESCHALCFDSQGKLWIATDFGLFRCNPDGSEMVHFGYGEGLPSLLISKDGISIDNDTVYVATSKGLMWMNMANMQKWSDNKNFRIALYDIYTANESVDESTGNAINQQLQIRLTWNIVSQSLRFKALTNDFAKPQGRFFEYRMDDERQWKLFRYNEEVAIEGLFLGNHRLYVRQAGKQGSQAVYLLKVSPSLLAYMELFVLVVSILLFVKWWSFYRNSRLVKAERNAMADALIEVQTQTDDLLLAQKLADEKNEEVKSTKYQQLNLSDEECLDIVNRMCHYLETERAYCNPNLKREDLASILHVTTAKLSYVFSMYLKKNYYEFINSYRLKEFKHLVAEGACSKYTITALSEKCGFKKSSFFSTFRKEEGMTPAEYLKREKIKVKF